MGFSDEPNKDAGLEIIIDGGGAAITTGVKGHLAALHGGTIKSVEIVADQVGSIVVDIWKDTYANFPPTDADSITSSSPPTLSSQQKNQDTTLSGWTTAVSKGDWFAFNVDSVSTVQRVTVVLYIEKS